MSSLLIIGAGGHGKVVADTARETGRWADIAFLDDRFPTITNLMEWAIVGKASEAMNFINEYTDIAVAIGNNQLRITLLKKLEALGFSLPIIIHPKAFVSSMAKLQSGTVVFAQAAINSAAQIGYGGIVNTGATIDHDCFLGKGVHISPGVHLGGEVCIGDYSWIGIGASVINKIAIGKRVVVGGGTVVIRDISDNATVVGVPGRIIYTDR